MRTASHVRAPRRTTKIRRAWTSATAAAVAMLVACGLAAPPAQADTRPPDGVPATVSADALPTVQVNGVVWAQAVVGRWVYVGGQFTSARPAGSAPGENETPRSNFLRYDLETGELDAAYDLPVNGQVLALAASPDGSTLYAGGTFTTAGGIARPRLVALDAASGAVVPAFTSGANAAVHGIAATDDAVWITGAFSQLNATPRSKIAALDARTGAVLPFNAVLDGGDAPIGRSIVVNADGTRVVVAGSFARANGSSSPGRGMAMLDARTGASMPLPANSVVSNADRFSGLTGLSADADSFYGTGYAQGGDGFEGSFRASWSTGELIWTDDCRGDSYGTAVAGDAVYKASHAHQCQNIGGFSQTNPWSYSHALAFAREPSGTTVAGAPGGSASRAGAPAARLLHWFPSFDAGSATGQNEATWSVAAGNGYVVYGGEFTSVQGVPQQGLVRFATADRAPNKTGPSASSFAASATSTRPGEAQIAWPATYDADNARLSYEVYRRDRTEPVATTTAESTRWDRPSLGASDTTVEPGKSYDYRVRAVDPFGNDAYTAWRRVQIATRSTATPYSDAVLADSPVSFWPLDERSGSSGRDWVSGHDLAVGSVSRSDVGHLVGTSSRSTRFFGNAVSAAATADAVPGPQDFSVEAWFKTSSNQGGLIVGFGSSGAAATSTSHDRSIHIDQAGVLTFAVTPAAAVKTITSGPGHNDGRWHHVVGSVGRDGMSFFVDGVRVGVLADTATAGAYAGHWRIASDSLAGIPGAPAQASLAGEIADVAVYGRSLTPAQVDAHWIASGRSSTVPSRPDDAYGQAVYDLRPVLYWRLGGRARGAIADAGPGPLPGTFTSTGTPGEAARRSPATPVAGSPGGSLRLTPDLAGLFGQDTKAMGAASRSVAAPTAFAIEGWINTKTRAGGKVFGFQDTADFGAGQFDRMVFMDEDGHLAFGTYNGTENTVVSRERYNDGTWHHVVAQQSGAGMELFVDGERVGSNRVANANAYRGFWTVGGGRTWAGANAWAGRVGEFAVYERALTRNEVRQHRQIAATGSFDSPPTAVISALVADDAVQVDGTGSSDAQGTLASYTWSFGDGTTAVGATASHAYAVPGAYTVMLTVTDSGGFSSTTSQTVTVAAREPAPVAAFAAVSTAQTVAVDATASTAADRASASYAWSFGDGGTAVGERASHAYERAGEYPVTLTVTDRRGASATVVQRTTVSAPGANSPPEPSFSSLVDGLVARVDASGSTDADGSIASYAWDFGDQTSAEGATAAHAYAVPGTYTVTLTVTDDQGARQSTSRPVSVVTPGDSRIATDAFHRSATGSWGRADLGGPWAVSGGDAAFSVADGTGALTLAPSDTRAARLSAVSSTDTVTTATVSTDQVSKGGVASVTVTGRAVGEHVYSARLRFEPGNVLRLYLVEGERSLGAGSYLIEGGYRAGERFTVQLSVSGTSPTVLGAKAWREGAAAPAAWQLTGVDDTAELQTAGSVGIKGALSAQSTVPATVLAVTGFTVDRASELPKPDGNRAPQAKFSASVSDLTASFDASGSADVDGTIAQYAWDFGDGQNGTGQTTAHTYAAPGAYSVTLTATDDSGASAATTTRLIVHAAPLADGTVARDAFNRLAVGGWGAAEVGGDWLLKGGSGAFGVADGRGTITLEPSWTREAVLPGAGGTDTVVDAVVSVDRTVSGEGAAGATLIGRAVGDSAYQARLRFEADGSMRLFIARDETALGSGFVLPGTWTPGAPVNVRLSVTGTSPTTVAAKAWADGSPEPSGWQRQAVDDDPRLQAAGSVGMRASLSSGATNARVVLSVDGFSATVR